VIMAEGNQESGRLLESDLISLVQTGPGQVPVRIGVGLEVFSRPEVVRAIRERYGGGPFFPHYLNEVISVRTDWKKFMKVEVLPHRDEGYEDVMVVKRISIEGDVAYFDCVLSGPVKSAGD